MNKYSSIRKELRFDPIPAHLKVYRQDFWRKLFVVVDGALCYFIDSTGHKGKQPKSVNVFDLFFLFPPIHQFCHGIEHLLNGDPGSFINKRGMKTLFDKYAFFKVGQLMLQDVFPDGMEPLLERGVGIIAFEKTTHGVFYAGVKQTGNDGFLFPEIDVQGAGSHIGFFGHGLHGDARKPVGFYQFKGSFVNLVNLVIILRFHPAKINEFIFIYASLIFLIIG